MGNFLTTEINFFVFRKKTRLKSWATLNLENWKNNILSLIVVINWLEFQRYMNWLEIASSGADNNQMTGIESSIAIKELDESLTEKTENVNDPKIKAILCQLTDELKQLKLDSTKKEREAETLKDEIHFLRNRVLNNGRYLSTCSQIITKSPITQHRNQTAKILNFLQEELLVSIDKNPRMRVFYCGS